MRNVFAITGKELRSYFVSPIAYVVLTGFLLLGGWFFFNLLARFQFLLSIYEAMRNPMAQARLNLNEFVVAPLLHNLSVVLVIIVPMITMRSFAEEKRSGTYELLMTSPLSVTEIVLGKFLGAFVFVFLMIGLTGIYPLLLALYGNPEVGVMLAGYLGLLLLATAFVTVGLLTSSFTDNQIVAAVSCLVALLLLYVISWPADTAGGTIGALLRYLSLTEHFGEMVKGVIDTRDLAYFVTVIAAALFLTQRSVESIRWR
ncbi:MAG: gliding motility-associated ABC transporter permease subunit GldF [Candidatus Binatia bacterium]|nr:MAG: gliding motility-associated ABC transporter permease subunit GldF [Candidatus Binatia bacterium]